MTHDIVFFPDYRAANPYQDLFYRHAASCFTVAPGDVAKARLALRLGGNRPVVFHLHWEDAVYRNEVSEAAAWRAARSFLDEVGSFNHEGGRLLWTLHNAAPHDGRYPAVHRALADKLAALADLVHVHGPAAATFARAELGLPPERVAIVPHGNFLPAYRPLAGNALASRSAFALPPTGRAVLLFGRLGAYKGGAELLEALADGGDGLQLVIAGKQVAPLTAAVDDLASDVRARVHVREGFVPHHDLPSLFHAVDIVAAPYRAVMTSGAVLLALSMRRPVIAPRLPGLAEILTDGHDALLYDPGSPGGLHRALRRCAELSDAALVAMQGAAGDTAARYDWASSGLLLEGLFHKLRASRRPYRLAADPAHVPAAATLQNA